jgi:zinc and cadmium transporter
MFTEKILHWHHCRDEHCNKHPFTYLLLLGDAIHNFLDGIIIAGSFFVSIPFGVISSILIILHELPQEIGDFGVLVYGGMTKTKSLLYNFISQLTAVLGGSVGFFFINSEKITVYLLPLSAGSFIYIAIADLIPELIKEKNPKRILFNFIVIIIGLLVLISGKFLAG